MSPSPPQKRENGMGGKRPPGDEELTVNERKGEREKKMAEGGNTCNALERQDVTHKCEPIIYYIYILFFS